MFKNGNRKINPKHKVLRFVCKKPEFRANKNRSLPKFNAKLELFDDTHGSIEANPKPKH